MTDRVLEELSDAECRRLLATAAIGRIAYTEGALPAIQPVSFAVVGAEVVIPTRRGSKVAAASRGAVVAFEVDEHDRTDRTGWNVTVVGASRLITDPVEVAALDVTGARAWAPADEPCYVAIGMTLLRGRRISLGTARPSADTAVSA
ncbi:pyridoxamine 5'-phosphate oxidase family protein [Modestobacter roseus]|uniref:Pyridoxamine 5'-phosphate oxidase-like protein n=1 Tax=Modestobacter roseus TaxID=1181884 RepID=A0A562IQF5_9ACTN|nr:pyridoxamine 5'-phosphate oxidase family protein [Modestobacter roseus]MQA34650.1 pyridoxamine 5'-phosphate oxidase family protein [Modestobacter roseus]TWH73122.1 pyridoxamine 5'-phosphate oxidase-like protein [Modestobacter roseus]